jgi:hypothetical protein
MAVMFADELFLSFATLTGLWYGQEKLEYPALLIVLECCRRNNCAADI